MPGPISAEQGVLKTRRYCGVLGKGAYRDGFSDDASTSDSLVPILGYLNLAIRILCDTGIVQGDFYISAPSGQFQFTYPSGMGKLVNMTVSGAAQRRKPLTEVTLIDLNSRNRYWEFRGGSPNVYATLGPDFVVFPVPDSPMTLKLRGHKLADDLVARGDFPSLLPQWYHEAYPLLGAIILLSTDDSPNRQDRIDRIKEVFLQMYPELFKLVTSRSIIDYKSRMEGDSLLRRLSMPATE